MQQIKLWALNMDAVLRMVILVGFALFFFDIVFTEKAQLYVHPRIIPYVKFSIAAFIMIALFLMGDVFKTRRKTNLLPYLIFIIPLIAAFFIPARPMESKDISAVGINISQKLSSNLTAMDEEMRPLEDESMMAPETEDTVEEAVDDAKQTPIPKPEKIAMDEKTFLTWLEELYSKPEEYMGTKIEIKGFVFRQKDLGKDQFITARFMMSCCTADAQAVGLLCKYEGTSKLKSDTWLKVTGRLGKTMYGGQQVPFINVEKIEKTDKPQNEYVYPY
ncbi:MAG: TIGR03943 family protein [Clostridia bacterium]|nr:TIGR03943 family protein [Clostridia bacterium]